MFSLSTRKYSVVVAVVFADIGLIVATVMGLILIIHCITDDYFYMNTILSRPFSQIYTVRVFP